jgi:hypothetical protein
MPIGLMERYCPLAKFEYTGSLVTLRKITYATFDGCLCCQFGISVEALAKLPSEYHSRQ